MPCLPSVSTSSSDCRFQLLQLIPVRRRLLGILACILGIITFCDAATIPSTDTPSVLTLLSSPSFPSLPSSSLTSSAALATSAYLIDSRLTNATVRAIQIAFTLHPRIFTQVRATGELAPLESPTLSTPYIDIHMGDVTLFGDRVTRLTGGTQGLGSMNVTCFAGASSGEVSSARTWARAIGSGGHDGVVTDVQFSARSSPFADINCAFEREVFVFAPIATLAVRWGNSLQLAAAAAANRTSSNTTSSSSTIVPFVATSVLLADCPDGYLHADASEEDKYEATTLATARCAPRFEHSRIVKTSVIGVVAFTLSAQCLLLFAVFLFRRHPVVAANAPPLQGLLLLGFILVTLTGLLFATTPSSQRMCDARAWILSYGINLSLASIVLRTEQVVRIFSARGLKRRTLTLSHMFMLIGVLLGLQAINLALEVYFQLFEIQVRVGSGSNIGYMVAECRPTDRIVPWLAVQVILTLIILVRGVMNALSIHRAALIFKETQSTSATAFLFLLMLCIILPLQDSLGDHPDGQALLMGVGLPVCSLVQTMAVFGTKCYFVYVEYSQREHKARREEAARQQARQMQLHVVPSPSIGAGVGAFSGVMPVEPDFAAASQTMQKMDYVNNNHNSPLNFNDPDHVEPQEKHSNEGVPFSEDRDQRASNVMPVNHEISTDPTQQVTHVVGYIPSMQDHQVSDEGAPTVKELSAETVEVEFHHSGDAQTATTTTVIHVPTANNQQQRDAAYSSLSPAALEAEAEGGLDDDAPVIATPFSPSGVPRYHSLGKVASLSSTQDTIVEEEEHKHS